MRLEAKKNERNVHGTLHLLSRKQVAHTCKIVNYF